MIGRRLSAAGVEAWQLHGTSLCSIGLCVGLWIRAKTVDQASRGNAERRAIFVGLWPPMLWLIGDAVDRSARTLKPGADSLVAGARGSRGISPVRRRAPSTPWPASIPGSEPREKDACVVILVAGIAKGIEDRPRRTVRRAHPVPRRRWPADDPSRHRAARCVARSVHPCREEGHCQVRRPEPPRRGACAGREASQAAKSAPP